MQMMGLLEELLAVVGEHDSARRALEQDHAERLLELLLRESGGCVMKSRSAARPTCPFSETAE
jgi:hypothetical protein